MKDIRVQNLAKILVQYSVRAKSRELIAVDGTAQGEPLMLAVYCGARLASLPRRQASVSL